MVQSYRIMLTWPFEVCVVINPRSPQLQCINRCAIQRSSVNHFSCDDTDFGTNLVKTGKLSCPTVAKNGDMFGLVAMNHFLTRILPGARIMAISAFYAAFVKLRALACTAIAGLAKCSATLPVESRTARPPFLTIFFKSTFWMVLLLDMLGRSKATGA